MTNLLSKYRPRTLSDVRGQEGVIRPLRQFAAAPYPCSMLFSGETGVGKSAAALALANDIGIATDAPMPELGGLHTIASGEQTVQALRQLQADLRYRPMFGSGWRMALVNECDRMRPDVEAIWLDALESIPERMVFVFTTNDPGKLSQRFRDRCECYSFSSDAEQLQPSIQVLAGEVWSAEGLPGSPPDLDTLGMPTLGNEESLHCSFRLAMQQLTKLVRAAKCGDLESARTQSLFDHAAQEQSLRCPSCSRSVKVKPGARKVKCHHCKAVAVIEMS